MAQMHRKFMFTEADKTRILKNFPSMVSDFDVNNPMSFQEVLNIRRKITRLELHAMMLSDYVKLERIPRGLRVQKAPAMFLDDTSFCEKWVAILNKCSADLMLLLIEKSSETIENLKTDLENSLTTLQAKYTKEEFDSKLKETEDAINAFMAKTKDLKMRKFDRDAKDYASNRVYKFLKLNADGTSTILKKTVSWANPLESGSEYDSSDYEIESASTSGDENNRRPFLDRKTKKDQRDYFASRKKPNTRRNRRM